MSTVINKRRHLDSIHPFTEKWQRLETLTIQLHSIVVLNFRFCIDCHFPFFTIATPLAAPNQRLRCCNSVKAPWSCLSALRQLGCCVAFWRSHESFGLVLVRAESRRPGSQRAGSLGRCATTRRSATPAFRRHSQSPPVTNEVVVIIAPLFNVRTCNRSFFCASIGHHRL